MLDATEKPKEEEKPDGEYDRDRFIADLRNNLAQPDKPIAFLFGAGTSCAVSRKSCDKTGNHVPLIPGIMELTNICKGEVEKLGDNYKKAWERIEQKKSNTDIEYILSRLQIMRDALSTSDETETLVGLNAVKLKNLEKTIRETIAKSVSLEEEDFPNELPHNKFARWLINTERKYPVEIFTVNYDTLIERALESERAPAFDGFIGNYKPFFYPESLLNEDFFPGKNWTRLWKIHGSITWKREIEGRYVRIIRGENYEPSGEMIFPSSQKYDDAREQPYTSLLEKFADFLKKKNALLITLGFSFRDRHINKIIFDTLKNRPTTNVYSLQYKLDSKSSELFIRSRERKNITVIGPETIIVGGKYKQLKSNSNKIEKTEKYLSHIVDFNFFCEFINEIVSQKIESHEIEPQEVVPR